jgi:hypothetical protein
METDIPEGKMRKVKCSYCGEDMDCPESMLAADVHVCSFCTDVMDEGMSREEIIEASREERKLSPYYKDVDELTDFVLSTTFKHNRMPKEIIKEMSKREIERESYISGILTAFDFLLHCGEPKYLRALHLFIKIAGVSSEKLKEALSELINQGADIDLERLKSFNGELTKPEDMARFLNEVFFRGDWSKHIEFIKKHGSERQKKEDIPLIRQLMEKEKKAG